MRTISNIFMSTLRAIAFLPMIIFMAIRDTVKGVKATVIKGAILVRQIVCFPLNVVIYVTSAVYSALDRFVSPLFRGTFWATPSPAKAEQAPTDVTLEDDAISDDGTGVPQDYAKAAEYFEALGLEALNALELSKRCENSYLADRRGATKKCCSQCGQPGHNIRTCK